MVCGKSVQHVSRPSKPGIDRCGLSVNSTGVLVFVSLLVGLVFVVLFVFLFLAQILHFFCFFFHWVLEYSELGRLRWHIVHT